MFAIKLCSKLNQKQSKNGEVDQERFRKLFGLKTLFEEYFKGHYPSFEARFNPKNGDHLKHILYFLFEDENFNSILVCGEKNERKSGRRQFVNLPKVKKSKKRDKILRKNNEIHQANESNNLKQFQTNVTSNNEMEKNKKPNESEIVIESNKENKISNDILFHTSKTEASCINPTDLEHHTDVKKETGMYFRIKYLPRFIFDISYTFWYSPV